MRLPAFIFVAAMIAAPVHAQTYTQPVFLGPKFAPSAIQAGKFDAVFDLKVAMPGVPVLLNQAANARFDVVVCNARGGKGGVQVDPKARWWSPLDAGECTMFANTGRLDLTTLETGSEWTAQVFLRAHAG